MIQPLEIKKEIQSRPPAQRDGAGEHYRGINICWKLRFKDVLPVYGKKDFVRVLAYPEGGPLVMYPDITMEVEKNKYPELNILKDDQIFTVTGKILEAKALEITLENCVLDFSNNDLQKNNLGNTFFVNPQIHLGSGDNVKKEENNILPNAVISNNKLGKGATLLSFNNTDSNKKNKSEVFWEKPWFQVIILISALAGIVGIFLN